MFDSTFFKFLITFAVIICTSFLIMGIAGGFNAKLNSGSAPQTTVSE